MLEQLKYQNHRNEVFEFGKDGIFVDLNELHDYEWTVTKKNNRVSALNRGIAKRKLPIVIICGSDEEGIAARNRLFEVVEKDVLAFQHGRIIIGDYYYKCFVTKSQKKNYLNTNRHMTLNLTLTTDFPYWVKESTFMFREHGGNTGGKNLDYPHDYAFDYFPGKGNRRLDNTGFVATDFRMTIYGKCENPLVYIAGHEYSVNTSLNSGEYLTIDSVMKTIVKTAKDGTTSNMFNLRNRESYIFEKIPSGVNTVVWDGDFSVDITLLEERSEPKWT